MLASNTLSHMSWRAVRRTFTTKRSMLIPWLMSFGRVNCKLARAMNAPGDNGTFKSLTLFVTSLSSDVRRVIGQIICLESAKLEYVQDFMKNEPLIQWFTGGDISEIPLYRWRHYRDYSLRQDDGRFGTPCMALALDHEAEEGTGTLRDETYKEHLEYLIRTERVICAGSLHLLVQHRHGQDGAGFEPRSAGQEPARFARHQGRGGDAAHLHFSEVAHVLPGFERDCTCR